jgi:hypothetical protein
MKNPRNNGRQYLLFVRQNSLKPNNFEEKITAKAHKAQKGTREKLCIEAFPKLQFWESFLPPAKIA